MESLELRIFREVAHEKSISKAAESLNYVQSNVTAHIKRLEEELGTTLFFRHGKGVTITTDGKKLLNYANTILELLDHAVSDFQKVTLNLRIGATQTLTAFRLPDWIVNYQKSFPDVACSVVTNGQDQLIKLLDEKMVDCAFVEQRYITPHMKSIAHFQEQLSVIVPTGKTIDTLADLPLIVNNIGTCSYRNLLINWVYSKTHLSSAIIEFDTVEGICKAVSLGMGISLLPTNIVCDKEKISILQVKEISALDIHMVTLSNQQNKEVYQFRDMLNTLN